MRSRSTSAVRTCAAAVMAASAVTSGACSRYTPIDSPSPALGSEVRLRLTNAGAITMAPMRWQPDRGRRRSHLVRRRHLRRDALGHRHDRPTWLRSHLERRAGRVPADRRWPAWSAARSTRARAISWAALRPASSPWSASGSASAATGAAVRAPEPERPNSRAPVASTGDSGPARVNRVWRPTART